MITEVKATCTICKTIVSKKYEINDRYYCAEHYQKYWGKYTDKIRFAKRKRELKMLDLDKSL